VEQIPNYAGTHDVDLVVLAKRGLRSIKRLILGRTTKRVLRHLKVPTLVVPATPPEGGVPQEPVVYRRIIATTDFSDASLQGLRATLSLAETLDAHVEYTHVLRLPVPVVGFGGDAPILFPQETREQLRHSLTSDLAETVGSLASRRCSPAVSIGVSVAQTLRDLALDMGADLIAIPSHGRGGMAAALFGGTVEAVIKLSPIPVLVLPAAFLASRYA